MNSNGGNMLVHACGRSLAVRCPILVWLPTFFLLACGGGGAAGSGAGQVVGDGVACGNATCRTDQSEVCCALWSTNEETCEASCPQGAATLACDGPEDCDGKVCCRDGTGEMSCKASAECGARVCHTGSDCSSGDKCAEITLGDDTHGTCTFHECI